jgi:hypothetical protein
MGEGRMVNGHGMAERNREWSAMGDVRVPVLDS